jgi:hypothetical protein
MDTSDGGGVIYSCLSLGAVALLLSVEVVVSPSPPPPILPSHATRPQASRIRNAASVEIVCRYRGSL